MPKDNIYTGEEARAGIMRGIKRCAEAVGATMGTAGNNVILEAFEHPGHYTTNDGATILASIRFADRLEEMGRKILLEAVSRANKQSGDGSSTTTVLTAAIIEEGVKKVADMTPMQIKRELEAELPNLEAQIDAMTKHITIDEVATVATISAEDAEIGSMIQQIYTEVGKDAIVQWDVSKSPQDYYTVGKGLEINGATLASPYMADRDSNGAFLGTVRIAKPQILVIHQKITTARDFNAVFAKLHDAEINDAVIFCDDYDPSVIVELVNTRIARGFRTAMVKMPVLWKDEWFNDIAIATGATIIDSAAGVPLKEVKADHLGTCGNIVIEKDRVLMDGIADLTAHIEELKADGSDAALVRAARLNVNTARYHVGAHSESALAYRRLKVEDAINAAHQALNYGVVPGGGVAMADLQTENEILIEALNAPFRRILQNAGISLDEVDYQYKTGEGYNTKTQRWGDMVEMGIIDPASVVKNALRNAISVAATLLTTNTLVLLPTAPTDKPQL